MKVRARVLAILVTAACGGPGGGGGSPDSSGPDTTPPQLVSSTPTGNAGVLATLTATFDEPLDPATVTAANVHLTIRLDEAFPEVAGTVSYDATTNSITFKPLRPLVYDAAYELTITAVNDTSGNPFGGAAVPFHAVVNAMTREVSYSVGQISGYTEYTLDGNGHQAKYVYYSTAGNNGTWFDSDDHATSHQESDYAADGRFLAYRLYDAGNDGVPNTNDDPVSLRDEYTYEHDGRLMTLAEHGTAQKYRLDFQWSSRRLMTSSSYDDPGNDLQWNTPDDLGPQWRDYTQDGSGANTRITIHSNGGDRAPNTNDDFIQSSTTYDIDPTTLVVTKQIMYGGPGQDTMWLTSDDAVANYAAYMTEAHGLTTTRWSYSAKGNDMTWFTPDDLVSGRLTITYNANLLETTRDSFNGAGNDGVWGTTDDLRVSYTTTTYDAAGNRTLQQVYGDSGNDGMWHTPDDMLSGERKFDTAH